MSYQVLARKWRPRTFADLVGQEHVVQALVNGLTRGQLHHAYLFTGTRGVGKTTLARILAKTLNCETGIGPTPCGLCDTCREIDEGRYVDLIEVDAASRTKVDQTRELLDNVPFAPVRGRFKVYLIDEVHMFSTSSFNALLKTLEEPPGHVKFVLATTDPQRLPATVLSRCLQFNLKRLLPEQIKGQFETVLQAEGIDFDMPALNLLATAADGSMRDGLSLLDQAIAFGGGQVREAEVRQMLGTRDDDLALDLLDALAAGDGAALLGEVERIATGTPDFAGLLGDLLALLHRVALAQQVPATLRADDPARTRIAALATHIPPEDVQLFYQILLLGQGDLPLAPNPRAGLEMVLLRALAFRPDDDPGGGPGVAAPSPSPAPPARPPASPAAAARAALAGRPAGEPAAAPGARPAVLQAPVGTSAERPRLLAAAPVNDAAAPAAPAAAAEAPLLSDPADWRRFTESGALSGRVLELARHCAPAGWQGRRLRLCLDPAVGHLRGAAAEQRLSAALSAYCNGEVRIEFTLAAPAADTTPAALQAREAAARQAEAEALMNADPLVQALGQRFGARLVPGSVQAA